MPSVLGIGGVSRRPTTAWYFLENQMLALNTLSAKVDQLALLKAQIANLKADEARIKEDLTKSGLDVIDGNLYRASISESDGKVVTDWRAVAQKLQPSRQLIAAYTTKGDGFFTVRVSARKTS
jgi:hypothetical protein